MRDNQRGIKESMVKPGIPKASAANVEPLLLPALEVGRGEHGSVDRGRRGSFPDLHRLAF